MCGHSKRSGSRRPSRIIVGSQVREPKRRRRHGRKPTPRAVVTAHTACAGVSSPLLTPAPLQRDQRNHEKRKRRRQRAAVVRRLRREECPRARPCPSHHIRAPQRRLRRTHIHCDERCGRYPPTPAPPPTTEERVRVQSTPPRVAAWHGGPHQRTPSSAPRSKAMEHRTRGLQRGSCLSHADAPKTAPLPIKRSTKPTTAHPTTQLRRPRPAS